MPDTSKQEVIPTQGVKYAGSKLRLLPHILRLVAKAGASSVLDGFSGTTRVSQALAGNGIRVVANDTADLSRIFAGCYLKADRDAGRFKKLLAHLNSLPGKDGWFTEHYGGDPDGPDSLAADGRKRPFQRKNTRRLDAIREEIDSLGLSEEEKDVALTSLILALDKVDSTIGHFASYLREWSPRSYNDLKLEAPRIRRRGDGHRVLQGDAAGAAAASDCDLAYYDPPYGSNNEKMPPSRVRYEAYYHFWKTVVLNDRPSLFGKAARRTDSADRLSCSAYEEFRKGEDGEFIAVKAIGELLLATRSRFVLLSYSSGGRATKRSLVRMLEHCGEIREVAEVDLSRNVMASMKWTHEWIRKDDAPNREYLFLLER